MQLQLAAYNHIPLSSPPVEKLNYMKKITVFLLFIAITACNRNRQTDPREKLKAAMIESLYELADYDSSVYRYRIEEVIYYEDKNYYDCQFKLTILHKGGKDTTGSVWAYVSKDFKEVKRTF
jgi:hypothetical protein